MASFTFCEFCRLVGHIWLKGTFFFSKNNMTFINSYVWVQISELIYPKDPIWLPASHVPIYEFLDPCLGSHGWGRWKSLQLEILPYQYQHSKGLLLLHLTRYTPAWVSCPRWACIGVITISLNFYVCLLKYDVLTGGQMYSKTMMQHIWWDLDVF